VGEIPRLSEIAQLMNTVLKNELLNEMEIFRLQYLCSPSVLHVDNECDDRKKAQQNQLAKWWHQNVSAVRAS
jgi:hypothetical protein